MGRYTLVRYGMRKGRKEGFFRGFGGGDMVEWVYPAKRDEP